MTTPFDEYSQRYIDSKKDIDPRQSLLYKTEGRIKNAKMWLMLVGGFIIMLAGIYYFFVFHQSNLTATLIDCSVGVIFILLGFGVDKKPKQSTLTGLGLYLIVIFINAAVDPETIYKGLIIKIIVIAALINGYRAAEKAEGLRRELGLIDESAAGDIPLDQVK